MRRLSTILASGELDGYRDVPPCVAIANEDSAICRELHRRHCWRQGLDYRPFSKPGNKRAFGVCPTCGDSQEVQRF